MRIADILETKGRTVHSIRLWKTVADVVTELGRTRVGALLVLDAHDTIAGIVSERDIVLALGRHGAGTLVARGHRGDDPAGAHLHVGDDRWPRPWPR